MDLVLDIPFSLSEGCLPSPLKRSGKRKIRYDFQNLEEAPVDDND